MLTAITLKNFKSFREARLPLAPLTVLIGANASGKSNAIEGLEFLAKVGSGYPVDVAWNFLSEESVGMRGRPEDIFREKDNLTYLEGDFEEGSSISIVFNLSAGRIILLEESVVFKGGLALSARNEKNNIRSAFLDGEKVNFIDFAEDNRSSLKSFINYLFHHEKNNEKNYQKIIGNILNVIKLFEGVKVIDVYVNSMRSYSYRGGNLNSNGKNVSYVLFSLWGGDETANQEPYLKNRDAILRLIRNLPEQNIAGLTFLHEPRGGVMVALQEQFGDQIRTFDASLLSDGTLRVLAVAAALLSSPEGSLIVIEEIDNGLHPSRAKHLMAEIYAIALERKVRVLLTTHNPALMDALPDPCLPDVVFCYRDPGDGSSKLVRLGDLDSYPALIAQDTLGHLVTRGTLDRFVKYRPSEEERKAKALAWLATMAEQNG